MLAALLAVLIAQMTPPAETAPSPVPAATVPAEATTPPAAGVPQAPAAPMPGRRFINDPSRRIPDELPPAVRGDAMVRNSGSTNFAGYAFVVHPDATVEIYNSGQTTHATIGAAQARWLFFNLKKDQPLDQMGAARCMKSASFGSSTTITYENHASPDLSCGGGTDAHELMRTIGVIVNQLGINVHRNRIGRPML